MIKSSVCNFFRDNPGTHYAYPCSCGYVLDRYEKQSPGCPNCGKSTDFLERIDREEVELQEPKLYAEEWTYQANG